MTDDTTLTFKQTYKSRIEVFRLFIQAQDLPIGRSQFYIDCDDGLCLVDPGKGTVNLCDILGYVRQKLNINAVTLMVVKDDDLARRKEKASAEKEEYGAEKLRRELDRDGDKYMLKDDHNAQQAALVGVLRDSIRHHCHIKQGAMVLACTGDQKQAPQLFEITQETVDTAFNEIAGSDDIEVQFEDEEDFNNFDAIPGDQETDEVAV